MGSNTNGGQRRELLGLLAFICWYVWRARNDWVFHKKWIGEQEILGRALSEYNELLSATAKEAKEKRQLNVTEHIGRKPPNQGILKINSDGDFDVSRHRGGVGLVARDSVGQVIWIAAIPVFNSHSAANVEALGFRYAAT